MESDLLDILRTNCHSIEELNKFVQDNSLSSDNTTVISRKLELVSAETSEKSGDLFTVLCSHFENVQELESAIERGILDPRNPTVSLVKKFLKLKCNFCGKKISSSRQLAHHKSICVDQRTCKHCKKVFSTRLNARVHQNICASFKRKCSVCSKFCDSDGSLRKHVQFCRRKRRTKLTDASVPSKKIRLHRFYCRLCNEGFNNRGDLFRHRGTQHGGNNDNNGLQQFEAGIENDDLRQEYDTNRQFILAPTRYTRDNTVYNFPTNDLARGFPEIEQHLDDVFESQVNAFKLNVSFGIILKNSATNQLRYFIPHSNQTLFNTSEIVTSRGDLDRIVERIKSIDVQDHIQNLKENSEWKPQMITNINYNVTPTNFPLGSAVELPNFILNKRSLVSLHKNQHKVPYKDNLCMFRALYYHRHKCINEEGVTLFFDLWKSVTNLSVTVQEFVGVKFSEIPLFEDTFDIGINMFELKSSSSAFPRFLTRKKSGDVMTLNIYHNHVSYATEPRVFVSKYICKKCTRQFRLLTKLKIHMRSCKNARTLKFPGKFVRSPTTIFETLEQYGIDIPSKERLTEYFCTFDFESMLVKTEQRVSEKLVKTNEHVPISCALKSNIPGFESIRFFLDENLENLIESMVKYLHELSQAVEAILLNRYENAFKILNEKLELLPSDVTAHETSIHDTAAEGIDPNQKNCAKGESVGFDCDDQVSHDGSDTESLASFLDDEPETQEESYPNPYLEEKQNCAVERTKPQDSMRFVRQKIKKHD